MSLHPSTSNPDALGPPTTDAGNKGSSFPSAGRLAADAGLASLTRRSDSSVKGEHPSRGGNERLKNALFLSAFAALLDPDSRVYYDRKRAQGKKCNAALICLGASSHRRHLRQLRDGTLYRSRTPVAA